MGQDTQDNHLSSLSIRCSFCCACVWHNSASIPTRTHSHIKAGGNGVTYPISDSDSAHSHGSSSPVLCCVGRTEVGKLLPCSGQKALQTPEERDRSLSLPQGQAEQCPRVSAEDPPGPCSPSGSPGVVSLHHLPMLLRAPCTAPAAQATQGQGKCW